MQTLLKLLKTFLGGIFMIGVFIIMVILINLGDPGVSAPDLKNTYWGGYYEIGVQGKVWILAKFINDEDKTKMSIFVNNEKQYIYDLTNKDLGENFIKYQFEDGNSKIEAKQFYLGKRYFFERLFAGRWWDFWEENKSDSIKGIITTFGGESKFALEKLNKQQVISFYNQYIKRNSSNDVFNEIPDKW